MGFGQREPVVLSVGSSSLRMREGMLYKAFTFFSKLGWSLVLPTFRVGVVCKNKK